MESCHLAAARCVKLSEFYYERILSFSDHMDKKNRFKKSKDGGPVLRFFDAKKPVTISCEASPTDLGGVLLQDECLVARCRIKICSN